LKKEGKTKIANSWKLGKTFSKGSEVKERPIFFEVVSLSKKNLFREMMN